MLWRDRHDCGTRGRRWLRAATRRGRGRARRSLGRERLQARLWLVAAAGTSSGCRQLGPSWPRGSSTWGPDWPDEPELLPLPPLAIRRLGVVHIDQPPPAPAAEERSWLGGGPALRTLLPGHMFIVDVLATLPQPICCECVEARTPEVDANHESWTGHWYHGEARHGGLAAVPKQKPVCAMFGIAQLSGSVRLAAETCRTLRKPRGPD